MGREAWERSCVISLAQCNLPHLELKSQNTHSELFRSADSLFCMINSDIQPA